MRCAHFDFSGMPEMSRLHVCVDLSFYPHGILMGIGLIACCTFSTGAPGRTKCPVAPVSAMDSCLDICITDAEYSLSIYLLV